jgi:predicted PurR-regulated permease PerM
MIPPTEKQARVIWFALTGLAVATVIALVVAAVWGLGRVLNLLSPVLWPLAIAAVVACLLSPVVDFLERKKVPRTRAIVLVFVLAFVLVLGVVARIVPQVVDETQDLAARVPDYSKRLQVRVGEFIAAPPEFLRHFMPKPPENAKATGNPENSALASATDWLTGSLPEMGSWLLGRIGKVASGFGLLAGLALIPVYAFHFLLQKRGIETHWKEYLPFQDSRAKNEVVFVLDAIKQYLVAYFRGQVLVAISDAVLFTIGFLLVGVNYSFLLGFAAVVLGVFAVVQTLEGLVISPKIMGNRVGLPPLAIIIAVMVGTTLFGGILGGVLAIPLTAALRVILLRYVWKKREA